MSVLVAVYLCLSIATSVMSDALEMVRRQQILKAA